MKELFWACLVLLATSTSLKAAETIASPFKIEFYTTESATQVLAKLKQSCRYEKIVWSDSSEYEAKWKETPLKVTYSKFQDLTKVKIELQKEVRMNVDGIFRPSKGCYSNIEVTLADTRFARGWGGQMNKVISFDLKTDAFYKKDESYLDVSKVEDVLSDNEVSFFYRAVGTNQVNVFLYINGERSWAVFPTNALRNPATNLPYPVQKP